ncbi:SEFIR domain-containing protein [Pedobacter antarcticus]
MAENLQPLIFISYCWESKDHEDHVISFANKLSSFGYHLEIDKIITQRHSSTHFIQMMEEGFFKSDKVIVILSEGYKVKADKFEGGWDASIELY